MAGEQSHGDFRPTGSLTTAGHVLYSTRVREQDSGGLKVTQPPPPPFPSLSNRLRLSEAGAFLQFVPTSLLNHLHYLTVFPSKGAPTLCLSLCKSDESVHSEIQPSQKSPLCQKGEQIL